jgi:predicted DNA-binding transcriptional regulator YafY
VPVRHVQGQTGQVLTALAWEDAAMRADRLVAILLMLQARGRVTAAEVAEELEISERTARRDLDALGVAGLPVYSIQGRNGGWELLGDGRTDLSGLTAAEARALFLVAGPSTTTPEMKAAVRKLVRALPETLRSQAEATASSVVLEPGWDQQSVTRPTPPHLDAVQRAVVEGEQLNLGYVARDRNATTRVVHPLGLAAKGSTWYLVANTDAGLRTFRVDRITEVEPNGERVVRPPDFDLAEAWRLITEEIDQKRAPVLARAFAQPFVVGWVRSMLGSRVRIGPAGEDTRV